MNEVKGQVGSITVIPGRENEVYIQLVKDGESGRYSHLLDYSDQLAVTWNGEPICCVTFIHQLQRANPPINVTLHPRADRYGTSTAAEFEDKTC